MGRIVIILFLLGSLALLAVAVTQPALTIEAKIEKSQLANTAVDALVAESDSQSRRMLSMLSQMLGLDKLEGQIDAYGKTRSIWGTVSELYHHDNVLVAVLVGAFSLLIPLFKTCLQLLAMLINTRQWRLKLHWLSALLSKWSMADVFVLALIITYLGGNADDHFGQLVDMNAQLHIGFWLFFAYCLMSIISSILINQEMRRELQTRSK
ncbi:paraquat-inducible membrane protein A [Pseudoalteromonas ruthenica]|uniref:Paraquat-inducible membrane protein A n=1 Tax=Pseudoalteromonas ruthenica TaxID=151081 RepID=A0A5S3Z9Y8_9GAMM|nr:paraquat-inducible protein A [Pseudoalteromonas ruthenica]TMP88831.1 paraquat-inducible membrane protein A [Pseudoalteromonas ruthenica]